MSELNLFIPLTKIDVEQRLVYGVATAESIDRSGEICDYASTKPFYEKWSSGVSKSTGGRSLGNLRAMHGKVAAGKLTDITFDDEARKIEVAAKVVDDAEWNKVLEGVYTGFSHGGKYVKRWTDSGGNKRYTAEPSELSLVDLPCLPEATFEVVKADGVETRQFVVKTLSEDEVAKRAWKIGREQHVNSWEDAVELAKAQIAEEGLQKAEIDTGEEAEPAKEEASETPKDEAAEGEKEPAKSKRGKKTEKWVEPSYKAFWSCGCADHEHVTKAEAVGCMKDALAKAAADEDDAGDSEEAESPDEALKEEYLARLKEVLPDFLADVADKFKAGLDEHSDEFEDGALDGAKGSIDDALAEFLAQDAEKVAKFDESAHPRDTSGKFSSGGGGSSGSKPAERESFGTGALKTLGHVATAVAANGAANFFARVAPAVGGPAGVAVTIGLMAAQTAAKIAFNDAASSAAGEAVGTVAQEFGKDKKATAATVKTLTSYGIAAYGLRGFFSGGKKPAGAGRKPIPESHRLNDPKTIDLKANKSAEPQDMPKPEDELTKAAELLKAQQDELTKALDALLGVTDPTELSRAVQVLSPAQAEALHKVASEREATALSKALEDRIADAALAAAEQALVKYGARNSAKDSAVVQAIHDHSAHLGAKCAESAGDAEKVEASGDLAKVTAEPAGNGDLAKVTAENEVLKSELSSVSQQVQELAKVVEALRNSPAPAKAAIFAVSKAADGGVDAGSAEDAFVKKLATLTPDEQSKELMKLALRVPTAVVR